MKELNVITRPKEKEIMIKSIIENSENPTVEGVYEELKLIDDLLVIMKSKSLLNKKQGLKRLLSGRIEMSVKNSSIVPGSSNLQLRDV